MDGSWPLNNLENDQFFVAYKVRAGAGSAAAPGTEDQYFSGLWLQRTSGVPTAYYKPVECQSLFEEYEVSKMFWQQIEGHWCPDMRGEKVQIQNASPANAEGKSYDFFFVLDTCEHLA